ncbi:MAG: DnaB-like helicase C-terminal domain-containing protein [bacterium]
MLTLEPEKALLMAMILNQESVDFAGSKLVPEDFNDYNNKAIFQKLLDMRAKGIEISLVTLYHELQKTNKQAANAVAYMELGDAHAAHTRTHVKIIKENSTRRKIKNASLVLDEAAKGGELEEALTQIENSYREIFTDTEDMESEARSEIKDLLYQLEIAREKPGPQGLYTPVLRWTNTLGGFMPGRMNILAARPGVGKSWIAVNCMRKIGIEQKTPCGFISLEMSSQEVRLRLACSIIEADYQKARQGLEPDTYGPVDEALRLTESSPIHIYSGTQFTPQKLRAMMQKETRKYGMQFWVLDYIQLMSVPGLRNVNRYAELGMCSVAMKESLVDTKTAGLVVAQLSRGAANRKTPKLQDLRESGNLEQDADSVSLFYYSEANECYAMDVAKNRHGSADRFPCEFYPGRGLIKDGWGELKDEQEGKSKNNENAF